ncbi:hypothetical protein FHG66_11330 [Rubellimicrobium rubrum]|uniref:Uncharacterized protein n=1 Tax=Rubellimicrobium rubrum TaxID=2585369 RepID=A0A5C4MX68_9RHOB|nr:hypothetical protein [Rubellimicrobium rubrum]TNC49318.1 hypothetical protein FHG66_11330 [Rubellimicrobium rubrum]
MENYIGFYWTLPVPWRGFTSLPTDPDKAAQKSRTIRYQCMKIRRWVHDHGGDLIGEKVIIERSPDRVTERVGNALERQLERCREQNARLVLVGFWKAYGWREHQLLVDKVQGHRDCVILDPDPLYSAEFSFKPVEHFRKWRDKEMLHVEGKDERINRIIRAIRERNSRYPSHMALADALNREAAALEAQGLDASHLRTPPGKSWTSDNLRKFRNRVERVTQILQERIDLYSSWDELADALNKEGDVIEAAGFDASHLRTPSGRHWMVSILIGFLTAVGLLP